MAFLHPHFFVLYPIPPAPDCTFPTRSCAGASSVLHSQQPEGRFVTFVKTFSLPSRKRRTMSLMVVFSCSHSLLQQCPLPSTTVSKAAACNLKVEETVFFFLRRCQHIHFQSSHFLFLQKKMTGQHSHQSIFLTHASFYNFYRANCLCLRRLSRCQY